ncbi:MAG TPA: preprotein translocase subunit SecG [Candidatus Avidesulfovibrio excrementigallinarum]|nr:preprotein translocase subunit SecG [Candidatus Avidesulfovibrio excrementigallinarum]
MESLILSLHVVVCVVLVVLVLLQSGKEGMGVIFGGGNASVFGSSGAGGLLSKLTAFVAVIFVATCLSYNILTSTTSQQESTILDVRLEEVPAQTSAAPATQPAAQAPAAAAEQPAAQAPAAPAEQPAAQAPAAEQPAAGQAPAAAAPAEQATPAEQSAPAAN